VIAFPFNQAYLMGADHTPSAGYIHEKLMRRGSLVDVENIRELWDTVRKAANKRYGR